MTRQVIIDYGPKTNGALTDNKLPCIVVLHSEYVEKERQKKLFLFTLPPDMKVQLVCRPFLIWYFASPSLLFFLESEFSPYARLRVPELHRKAR